MNPKASKTEKNSAPRVRVAAIIVQDDKILLAQHKRKGRKYWVPPGGGVDFGESLEEALIRELQEEASVTIRVGELVMVNDSVPPDKHRHIINLFFRAEIVSGTLKVGTDDKRLVGMKFVSLAKVPQITLYPDVRNELVEIAKGERAHLPIYLGNLWREAQE